MGFYKLVMLLNKQEGAVLTALRSLECMGLIEARLTFTEDHRVWDTGSRIAITNQGILFLEKGTTMKFNNLNIVNSTVGVVSIESTLQEIDVAIGNLNQKGQVDIAKILAAITEQVTNSTLPAEGKADALQQVEQLGEQAAKEPAQRKPAIIKGSMAFLEKALSVGANLATLWATWGPALSRYFGI
jgi:hypothetical protein